MYVLVACVIVCVDLMMMLSAYEVTCTDACGRGVADVHRLNSMGEFAYSSVFSQKVVTRHNCVLSKQSIKSLN